jgi:S1-C subfamily serine protease
VKSIECFEKMRPLVHFISLSGSVLCFSSGAGAFVVNNRQSYRLSSAIVRVSDPKVDEGASDQIRRNILATSFLGISSVIGSTPSLADQSVSDKVVLSATTTPVRYAATSTSAVTQSTIVPYCQDADERRMEVFERTAPSVVFIDTFTEQRDQFSTNVMEVPLGSGSGFIWDDKGHVVTNYHVVRNARSASVAILTRIFPDDDDGKATKLATVSTTLSRTDTSTRPNTQKTGITDYKIKVYKARVVGVDPGKDIAVLKVDAPVYDLYPIEVGSSKGVRVGQTALAIGNPFGLDHTLTAGIISGLGREVRSPTGQPISNVIQTDAAINPGNSGGTLLDASGKLIGMNTAIYSPSGASAGIGFAIPVDTVKFIVDTLIRDGKVVRPVLGISYLQSKQARALGISKGVLVLDVPVDSPAYKAGMKPTRRTESGLIEIGDIIVKVDQTEINTEGDLFQALENFKPGDKVKVTVNRLEPNGNALITKEIVLTVQLKASPNISQAMQSYDDTGGGPSNSPPE